MKITSSLIWLQHYSEYKLELACYTTLFCIAAVKQNQAHLSQAKKALWVKLKIGQKKGW